MKALFLVFLLFTIIDNSHSQTVLLDPKVKDSTSINMKHKQEKRVHTQVLPSMPPPLSDFTSNFNSIADWVMSLCNSTPPDRPIDAFNFNLYELPRKRPTNPYCLN